jgi:sialate O-acetylesterase
MEIQSGLFSHMVMQRNARNRSEAAIRGTASADGDLVVRACQRGRPVPGWTARKIGRVSRKQVKAVLSGLPTGGPYDLDLRVIRKGEVVDHLLVKNVLVGDVWIVGGQSNMQGCGLREHEAKPHPLVRAFYMDDRWDVAADPIHNMWDCVDQVHIDLCGGIRPALNTTHGVGPAVAFGTEMQRLTGVPQGLLACAHGGTSMTQWDPARRDEGGKSLYGATIRRLHRNGGRAAGLIWYQGESDANAEAAPLYTRRMKELIRCLRRDTRFPRLPVAVVQLCRLVGSGIGWEPWNSIQDQERRLAESIPQVAVVPAIDLTLEDCIHVGGEDVNRLGRRLAQAMHAMTAGRKGVLPPIRVRAIAAEPSPPSGTANVVVTFDNVIGRLVAPCRPVGFHLVDPSGQHGIYDILLDGDRAILRVSCPASGLSDKWVCYGYGLNPVCNITDEADRSVPVFGPLPASDYLRAFTPFAQSLRVTQPLPGAGDLTGLAHPGDLSPLPWRKIDFPTRFCDLHLELGKLAPQDLLVYFACTLDVPEKMRLAVCVGYDGPTKVWIDRKEVFHDPKGTNPAWEDRGKAKFDAEPGRHEILVGLGTNQCRAWGIFLRFERFDVPKRLLQQGPGNYVMPTILAE